MLYSFFICLLFFLTLPLQFLIAFLQLLFVGPPVIYIQKRTGFRGKPFLLYKFRTMIDHADTQQARYKHLNEAKGPAFKIHNDPRFTWFGRFLSHTGLDELPQLYNVLRGDMALFGPRPLPVYEAKKLVSWQKERHMILPGILSPWVLDGYHKRKFDEWMKSDIMYVHNKTTWYDMQLFFRAIVFMTKLFMNECCG